EVIAIAADSWITTAGLMYVIEYFHLAHGMEWYAAIAAATCVMRVCAFPLTIMQQKSAGKMHLAKPEMTALQESINEARRAGEHERAARLGRVFAIWSKHDVHPAKMLAPLLFQAPVFISFYFAISRMAEGLPSMRDGGFAWFQDLSIADPTFALPIISSLTFLAAVEFAPQNPAVKSSQREMTKWGLRALGVAMVPLTASFPSGVFVYWITSNVFSFAQTVLLRVPFAKRAMGIPEDPPP
ncbi:cytochrome oxidase biogenesis family, partial [Micromonas pusilla CCMP1545]